MNNANRPRLTRGEFIALAFVVVSGIIICTGILLQVLLPKPITSGTPARYVTNYQGHWLQGDSVYDAASQAKLIALTHAFYDTNDEDERVVIADMANDIRAHAGLIGDDCLVEDSYVLLLGHKLDDAVKNGVLSKGKLLELAHSYIRLQPSDTSEPDAAAIICTFGKVDMIISKTANTTASDNSAAAKFDFTLTPKAHYSAYVIYNAGWEVDCIDAVKALEVSGITAAEIGTASITSYLKFTDSWNSIDLTQSGSGVPYVIIDSHATPAGLLSDTFKISTAGISQLPHKRIDHLILLGCNAGHMNFESTNPAAAFAKLINGGFVMASDGNVISIGSDQNGWSQYESRNDDAFQAYIGTDGRSSLGWMVYRYSGRNLVSYSTAVYTYTIPGILDYFKPVFY